MYGRNPSSSLTIPPELVTRNLSHILGGGHAAAPSLTPPQHLQHLQPTSPANHAAQPYIPHEQTPPPQNYNYGANNASHQVAPVTPNLAQPMQQLFEHIQQHIPSNYIPSQQHAKHISSILAASVPPLPVLPSSQTASPGNAKAPSGTKTSLIKNASSVQPYYKSFGPCMSPEGMFRHSVDIGQCTILGSTPFNYTTPDLFESIDLDEIHLADMDSIWTDIATVIGGCTNIHNGQKFLKHPRRGVMLIPKVPRDSDGNPTLGNIPYSALRRLDPTNPAEAAEIATYRKLTAEIMPYAKFAAAQPTLISAPKPLAPLPAQAPHHVSTLHHPPTHLTQQQSHSQQQQQSTPQTILPAQMMPPNHSTSPHLQTQTMQHQVQQATQQQQQQMQHQQQQQHQQMQHQQQGQSQSHNHQHMQHGPLQSAHSSLAPNNMSGMTATSSSASQNFLCNQPNRGDSLSNHEEEEEDDEEDEEEEEDEEDEQESENDSGSDEEEEKRSDHHSRRGKNGPNLDSIFGMSPLGGLGFEHDDSSTMAMLKRDAMQKRKAALTEYNKQYRESAGIESDNRLPIEEVLQFSTSEIQSLTSALSDDIEFEINVWQNVLDVAGSWIPCGVTYANRYLVGSLLDLDKTKDDDSDDEDDDDDDRASGSDGKGKNGQSPQYIEEMRRKMATLKYQVRRAWEKNDKKFDWFSTPLLTAMQLFKGTVNHHLGRRYRVDIDDDYKNASGRFLSSISGSVSLTEETCLTHPGALKSKSYKDPASKKRSKQKKGHQKEKDQHNGNSASPNPPQRGHEQQFASSSAISSATPSPPQQHAPSMYAPSQPNHLQSQMTSATQQSPAESHRAAAASSSSSTQDAQVSSSSLPSSASSSAQRFTSTTRTNAPNKQTMDMSDPKVQSRLHRF